jgi:hypothetical protein
MKYANEMAGVTEARKQGEIEGRINALSAALSTAEDAARTNYTARAGQR